MQDETGKVNMRELVQRVNKLGIKLSEAPAIEVPIIKRVISLKKVMFELYSKAKKIPEHVSWMDFREAIQGYRFYAEPSID